MKSKSTYIITIDGTSGSGKSTISKLLAQRLNFTLLDSGKLYRSAGYIISKFNIPHDNLTEIKKFIKNITLKVNNQSYEYMAYYENSKIDHLLYSEEVGKKASIVSKIPTVRECMLQLQHSCVNGVGLIANGRDMGSEVYPNADLKLYITASLEIRARRRFNELINKGESVKYEEIYDLLKKRDDSDMNRSISPLKVPDNAQIIDSSDLNPDAILDKIINLYTITRN